MRETLNIENLNCNAVDSKPLDVDWSQRLGEDLEGYRYAEAMDCPECGESLVMSGPCGYTTCPGCEAEVEEEDGGPMMNYCYPVKLDDIYQAAEAVADWPVCVVEFDDGETALALTGGGMDLSWEICGAFIALGFLPPVHFCRLPEMAGWEQDAWRVPILKAARESCEVAERWAVGKRKSVEDMLAKVS